MEGRRGPCPKWTSGRSLYTALTASGKC